MTCFGYEVRCNCEFFYFKSGTDMSWNWISRDSGMSFGHPALRRFLLLFGFFDDLMHVCPAMFKGIRRC
jgi:hypothetical protein